MKGNFFLFLVLFFLGSIGFAQKTLTIEDSNNPNLRPKPAPTYTWLQDQDIYFGFDDLYDGWYFYDPKLSKKDSFSFKTIKNSFFKLTNDSTLSNKSIEWSTRSFVKIRHKSTLWHYFPKLNQLTKINIWPSEAENLEEANNGNIAFTQKGNVYVKTINGEVVPLTQVDGYQVVCGEAVHRNEFGISKGLFWSENGKKLAFYRMDQSDVSDYPLIDYQKTPCVVKNIKYPMAGSKSHYVTVGIYDTETGNTVYLNTGLPKDQYLTNLCWDPSGNYLYIAHLNRDQNHIRMVKYDCATAQPIKVLFEEKNAKYIEPQHPMEFLPKSNKNFIWLSRRDGFDHIYLYDTSGTLLKQVTNGQWMVEDFHPGNNGSVLFFNASMDNGFNSTYHSVNIKTGTTSLISTNSGFHKVNPSPSNIYFLDAWSTLENPGTLSLISKDPKTKSKDLFQAVDPYKEYIKPSITIGMVKDAEGRFPLRYRLIVPPGFDSTKKYPVLHYVYGGPGVQLIQNRFLAGADQFLYYMASKGFVVTTLDNRGTSRRGYEFETSTFRKLGQVESADQAAFLSSIKTQPWIDSNKLACFGWSFGGFMTTTMMTKYPDLFKIGIAGGPVVDWSMYEIMYTERYMDTPDTNPEGYLVTRLQDKVEKLKGRLLMIHGLQDDVVLPQHSEKFLSESVKKGKLTEYYPYAFHPHNVRGKDRTHLYKKIEDFIISQLHP